MTEYAPGSVTPSVTFNGLNSPSALALDSSGNLYVANGGNGTVSKFVGSSTTPTQTFTAGGSSPSALAVDSAGNVYVVYGTAQARP